MRLSVLIPGGVLALALAVFAARPALCEATVAPDAVGTISASSLAVAPSGAAAQLTGRRTGGDSVSASSHAVATGRPSAAGDAGAALGAQLLDDLMIVVPLPRRASRPADHGVHPVIVLSGASLRPQARPDAGLVSGPLPQMRWDHRAEAEDWTRATLAAVDAAGLPDVIPADIATWCPAYRQGDARDRAAFWAGLLSALARHESTHDPRAVGGGGLYHGLLQILPATARQYGCEARSPEALRDGEANLECAVRIAARNVLRDAAIARDGGRNAGLARDWGPMTVAARRAEMAAWTAAQDYCSVRTAVLTAPLPPARPWTLASMPAPAGPETIELAMLSQDIRDLRAIPALTGPGG